MRVENLCRIQREMHGLKFSGQIADLYLFGLVTFWHTRALLPYGTVLESGWRVLCFAQNTNSKVGVLA